MSEGSLSQALQAQEFYSEFLIAAELKEGFDAPGVRFSVTIDTIKFDSDASEFMPIPDGTMRELIDSEVKVISTISTGLSEDVNIVNILSGLEEVSDQKTTEQNKAIIAETIRELIKHRNDHLNGEQFAEQRSNLETLIVTLAQIYASQEDNVKKAKDIGRNGNIFIASEQIDRYWGLVGTAVQGLGDAVKGFVKERRLAFAGIMSPKSGTLDFELTDRRWQDMLRGFYGDDCTKDAHFFDTAAHMVDPAVLHFKIKEEGRIVGYLVCIVAQDAEGDPVLIVDSVQLGISHYLSDDKQRSLRDSFVQQFLDKLEQYAKEFGFKQIVFAKQEGVEIENGESRLVTKPTYISNRKGLGDVILKALQDRMSQEPDFWRLETGGRGGDLLRKYRKITADGVGAPALEMRWDDSQGRFVAAERLYPWLNGHLLLYGFPDYYRHFLQGFDASY
mgnify:CR=1 FL=1